MTAPSSERTAPHFERRDQPVPRQTVCPPERSYQAEVLQAREAIPARDQPACRAHLGLPLAPAFNTSKERGKCFCAESRYSLCAAWWLSWGGPRPARLPRRLLRHHLQVNPKINSHQAHTEVQERPVKVGPAAERARGRAVALGWAVQAAVIREPAGRVTAAAEREPTTADQPGPQGDNQRTCQTQQNSSAPRSTNRVSRGSKQR